MIVNGEAVSCISSMGDSGTYDLIVMGTTGASGIKEVFMGSVAGGVISHTVAPVLVVPSSGTFEKIETIVLGVGNKSFDSAAVVDPLKHLKEVLDCQISIVHISDESDEGMDEILAPVKGLGEVVNLERQGDSTDDQLSAHMEQVNGGILALIRGKVDFLNRLLKGSVTMRQTFHTHVPILILHG